MDRILVLLLRFFFAALNALPLRFRLSLAERIVRILYLILPKLKRVSLENLKLAFPLESDEWRSGILERNYASLARMFVDFARLPHLDERWIREHVETPYVARYAELHRERDGKGILIATGHLGSFELMAHAAPTFGFPMSFVVRNAKLPNVDAWWRSLREANGNRVISRQGAIKEVIDTLQRGRAVGILFDQNVTKNHAVFVDWFGKPAATTKAVALAALRTDAVVLVASVAYLGDERYRVNVEEFNFDSIYRNEELSRDDKVFEITSKLAKSYEGMIRRSPHEWFWMHRRWRTRPEAE